jgi:uncharacterized protein
LVAFALMGWLLQLSLVKKCALHALHYSSQFSDYSFLALFSMDFLWRRRASTRTIGRLFAKMRLQACCASFWGAFDPNTLDAEGNSGLTLALSESSFKVADVLLALDEVDVHTVNKAGWNALSLAAIRGNEGAVRRLIERKVDVPKSGLTPLHHAALGGHVAVMRLLLERGSSPDALGPRGNTPLMLAAHSGNAKAVQLLLEAGAQPRLKNHIGKDALGLAQLHGNTDAARILAAVTPRSETLARLPALRSSASTLTPALPMGPIASSNRARAAAPAAEPVVQATAQPQVQSTAQSNVQPVLQSEPARGFSGDTAARAGGQEPAAADRRRLSRQPWCGPWCGARKHTGHGPKLGGLADASDPSGPDDCRECRVACDPCCART